MPDGLLVPGLEDDDGAALRRLPLHPELLQVLGAGGQGELGVVLKVAVGQLSFEI